MIDIDLRVQHHFMGDTYMREMHLPAGHVAQSHRHKFDHVSVLAAGQARVTVDGISTDYAAPACIAIRAGAVHTIVALNDVAWFCIHDTTETDPERIDHELIAEEV